MNSSQMEIQDRDIQVLMKITLLTPTNNEVNIIIPFVKKFCPKLNLINDIQTYVPLFHTIELQVSTQKMKQTATIDLTPLIQNPNHEHYLNVQTYSSQEPQKACSRYAFHLQFAQMIVKANEPNYMQVNFRKIALKMNDARIKQMNPYLRVVVSHGSSWNGKSISGSLLINYDQSTTLMYQSLLDTMIIQILNQKTKLCQVKKFIFELLGNGSRIFDMQGEIIKKASIKISSKPTLPIVIID